MNIKAELTSSIEIKSGQIAVLNELIEEGTIKPKSRASCIKRIERNHSNRVNTILSKYSLTFNNNGN